MVAPFTHRVVPSVIDLGDKAADLFNKKAAHAFNEAGFKVVEILDAPRRYKNKGVYAEYHVESENGKLSFVANYHDEEGLANAQNRRRGLRFK